MKKFILFVLTAEIAFVLAGCETIKGVGRDITSTSDSVQRAFSKKGG